MLKQGLVSLLLADTAVAALIGTRLYPVVTPPELECYPSATYQFISSAKPEFTLDKRETDFATIQFDAYGRTYAEADAVLSAFRNVLNGFVGPLTGGARIIFAQNTNDTDHFEEAARVYRSISEYDIEYVEPNH